MTQNFAQTLVEFFSGLLALPFGKELIVFIISMMPILELRGGLIAAALLNMNPVTGYVCAILGNLIPVPFILLFYNTILDAMRRSRFKLFNRFANSLYQMTMKRKDKIETYGFWGLVLFVGIPLPGTGAWTGDAIAALLNMDRKKAFGATLLGVFMASIIMMLVSFGIIGNLF